MSPAAPRVTCIGGVLLDRRFDLVAPPVPGTSNPARVRVTAGGVARNVAETLARLGVPVSLVSRVGADAAGLGLKRDLDDLGVDTTGVVEVAALPTAEYVAVLEPAGELVLGLSAAEVLDGIGAADVDRAVDRGSGSGWIMADANLRPDVLRHAVAVARERGLPLALDGVSTAKVVRLPGHLDGVALLVVNRDEARAWLAHTGRDASGDAALLAGRIRAAGASVVVVAGGAAGAVAASAEGTRHVAAPPADVVDVTGAGDALAGGTLAGLIRGLAVGPALTVGIRAAAMSVAGPRAVSPALGPELLQGVSAGD